MREKVSFNKAIKKIAAVTAGIGMLGATLTGAAGASMLENYPEPFVTDFQMNSLLVIGAAAQTADVIGAVAVGQSLQVASSSPVTASQAPRGSGALSLSGDNFPFGDTANLLEIGERMGDVEQTVSEFQLDALKGGVITTDEGSTEYNQYLKFKAADPNSIQGLLVTYGENDEKDEKVGDFLYAQESSNNITFAMFEYELQFEEGLESDILFTTTGSTTSTRRGELEDIEDEVFNILGVDYTFVDSDIDLVTGRVTLDFLGGDITDTMEEGEIRTYTIDGVDYEVELMIVSDAGKSGSDTAKFKVNGEVTDELKDGETDTLSDGLQIGIRDILPNEAEEVAGGDLVEFFLGANKISITDVYTDSTYSQGVEVTEEDIEEGYVQIKGQSIGSGNATFEIFSIKYRLLADARSGASAIYVPPGHGLREFLDEPEGMLNANWDIRYEGLMDTGVTTVIIDANGDDEYNLKFTNTAGNDYNIPLADNSNAEAAAFKLGEDADSSARNRLNFVEGFVNRTQYTNTTLILPWQAKIRQINNINDDDYFIVSYMDSDWDDTAVTHVLRYESIDTSNRELTFEDLSTGTVEITYTHPNFRNISGTATGVDINNATALGKATLVLPGGSFDVYVANDTSGQNAYAIAVDLNGDGDVGENRYGLQYFLNNLEVNPLERSKITIDGGGILDLGGCNNTRAEFPTWTAGENPLRNNRTMASNFTGRQGNATTWKFPIGNLVMANNSGANVTEWHYWQDNSLNTSFTIALHTESSEFDENDGDEVVCINIRKRASNEVGLTVIEEVYRIPGNESQLRSTRASTATNVTRFNVGNYGEARNETGFNNDNGINPKYDFSLDEPDENEDFNLGMTQFGILFSVFDEDSSDEPEELTIEYPLSQRGAHVFVVAGDQSVRRFGGGGAVIINPIDVGATLLDREVANMMAQNEIVVGGPCVNTHAAELMGNNADCTTGFAEGEAIIKLFEHSNGNVALLVAGYSADDTRVATNVLSQWDRFNLGGTEVKVNTQTEQITVVG